MYFRVHRYNISKDSENSVEAVVKFVHSRVLEMRNGIAKVGEDTYLILVEEEEWSESGNRSWVKYRPVSPNLQPIATAKAESSKGIVSSHVKVNIYPFASDEVVVREEGGKCWGDRAKVSWGGKLIFRRDSDLAEEVLD